MKKFHSQCSILFISLAILLTLTSCDESVRMIEPDDDSQQTLIIWEGEPESNPYDIFNGNAQNYARMYIYNHQTERISWPDNVINRGFIEIIVVKRNSEQSDTLTTVDLGSVQLGSFVFERNRTNDGYSSSIMFMSVDSVTIMPEWEFEVSYEIDQNDRNPIPGLDGTTPFSIRNSPDIRDVSTELDIPDRNVIMNILPGQEIDPNQDFTVQVKCPIGPDSERRDFGSFLLMAYEAEEHADGRGVHIHGTGTIFMLTKKSDTIVIPSKELLAFIQDHPNKDFYTIGLNHNRYFAEVPLYDHDGNLYQILKVLMADRHWVEISFKK